MGTPCPPRLDGCKSCNFVHLGEVKIFLISGGRRGCPMMGGVYFVVGGQFIFRPFSHFQIQDFKNSFFCLRCPHV